MSINSCEFAPVPTERNKLKYLSRSIDKKNTIFNFPVYIWAIASKKFLISNVIDLYCFFDSRKQDGIHNFDLSKRLTLELVSLFIGKGTGIIYARWINFGKKKMHSIVCLTAKQIVEQFFLFRNNQKLLI